MNTEVSRKFSEYIREYISKIVIALLQPAITDHVLVYNNREQLSKSPKHQYFSRLSKTTVNELAAAENQIRSVQNANIENTMNVLNRLLRTSEASRGVVLESLGRLVCDRGWQRSTLSWQQTFTPHAMGVYEHLFKTPQLGGSLERFRALVHLTKPNNLPSGFAVNLASVVLELILPIKAAAAPTISALYLTEQAAVQVLGQMLGEARMAPKETVQGITAAVQGGSFKEGIFWLGLGAVHSLLVPALKEAEMCVQVASMMHRDKKPEQAVDDAYGEWQCFEAMLLNPKFVQSVGHLLNLAMAVVLKAATGKKTLPEWLQLDVAKEVATEDYSTLTDEFAVIPGFVLEDMIELLISYKQLFEAARESFTTLTTAIDPDVYIAFLLYILGSDAVKNPQIRGKAASVLHSLLKSEAAYAHRLRENPFCTRNILPACIRVFTAVEKTKQSYYDIRFHIKFQLRMPIQELFEQLLVVAEHRKALVVFASVSHQDEFVKFVNQLLNDTAYLLDEGLDTLLKIRQGTLAGPESAAAPVGEAVDEGQNNSRSVQDPKEHCRMYNKLARQTLSTLHTISKESSSVIVENRVLLEQLLTSCVDPMLDRLVGPRALELKGETRDFEVYEFDPKYLINRIAELYVFLARPNQDRVRKIVAEDLRYYKPETFRKAVNILRRERLLSGEMLKEFETFVQTLNEFATQQKSALDSVEIPDEFLDPLMASIMVDPVLLPTSGNIVDRSTITRIILSDDHDPFNRLPLRFEDLVPQEELKARIMAFCTQHNIKVDEL